MPLETGFLCDVELGTMLAEVEFMVSNRPITAVSDCSTLNAQSAFS